ncbi:MAG: hypothetical protein A2X40_11955 [Elusimicrobia bacterium GWC2_65_9]|nr:MAG: hypothetical protein A2X37_01820 [Elusimicrobia bacterium GWA2_66_18]OGR73083.1 MAG: hypothetical protein A2X40_11955 [Elusimicrobia bacterium GWC2_65_9]
MPGEKGLRTCRDIPLHGLLVERVAASMIVELKAVDRLQPVFLAQLPTYLKLTELRLGLLSTSTFP